MTKPWEKYGTPEVVSEGGPWTKYGQDNFLGTMMRGVERFQSGIDTGLERDLKFGAPFMPHEDSDAEERRKMYALNRYYDKARFETNDENERRQMALDNYYANDERLPEGPKMGAGEAFAKSAAQAALDFPVIGDAGQALAEKVGGKYMSEDPQADLRAMKREAREDQPWASFGGDMATYLAPGAKFMQWGSNATRAGAQAVLPQGVRAAMTPAGNSMAAQAGRYIPGVVAPTMVAGAGDLAAYEATIGASNIAADEDRDVPIGERAIRGVSQFARPEGYVGGAVVSPAYRTGRYAVTAGANTIDASKQAGKLSLKGGAFTPTPRAQWAAGLQNTNDPRSKAYRMVAKRLESDGVTTEQLNQAIDNYYYAGYSSVDEMLFELAEASTSGKGGGKLKQLAVALGSVGGDAQQTARTNFNARKAEMPTVFREELRKAAGLEGSDFYQYADEIAEQRRTLPGPLYDEAYGKAITDDDWTSTVWPLFESSPSAHQAIDEAYKYARDIGKLEVANEIASVRAGIPREGVSGSMGGAGGVARGRAGANVPAKPSTEALDYIDRMLGDKAQSLRTSATKRTELAKGPSQAQTRLRSVVDEQTGLNAARDKSAELIAAEEALDFGRKGFAQGMDLETLQREFGKKSGRYGTDFIDPALLMGWMRGAEDAIEKATNPGTVIRQIYGSDRQRSKLLAMLPDGEGLGSGFKADATKRRNVLTGRTTKSGDEVAGRFDRARRHLDSENQIVGNSQTGQRNEAVAAQGGMQRMANVVADTVMNPRETVNKGIKAAVNRATQPGIFNPKVNRELGDIMFTGGRENLQHIVRELEALQAPPGGPVAPPAPVAPAAAGSSPPPGGPTPSAAVAASRGELPMDEASRMARAREQGFDTDQTLYHGTDASFDAFDPSAGSSENGVFLTRSPAVASRYAGSNNLTPPEAVTGKQVYPLHVRGRLKKVNWKGRRYDDDEMKKQIEKARKQGYDGLEIKNIVDESGARGERSSQSQTVMFDPKNIRSKFAMFDPANADKAKMSGMININGKPMRRKDALKQVSGDQFPPAPGSAAPPPPVTPQAAVEASGTGIMESPVPILGGIGAAGTAGIVLHNQMNQPPVAGGPAPSPNPFLSSVMGGAEAAQQAAQQRQADGFPPPPGLKPDLAPMRKAAGQSSNQDAKSAESARRQEYYRQLNGPDSVLWNQIHQQRAGELKVTPEDRQRGVSRKRLKYGYEIPVESLSDAPVEELINGQWVAVESAPAGAR